MPPTPEGYEPFRLTGSTPDDRINFFLLIDLTIPWIVLIAALLRFSLCCLSNIKIMSTLLDSNQDAMEPLPQQLLVIYVVALSLQLFSLPCKCDTLPSCPPVTSLDSLENSPVKTTCFTVTMVLNFLVVADLNTLKSTSLRNACLIFALTSQGILELAAALLAGKIFFCPKEESDEAPHLGASPLDP